MHQSTSSTLNSAERSTDGRRIYAIGDVHGRLDLLQALVRQIVLDCLQSRPDSRPMIVLLGDYIDRGPQSAEVLSFVSALQTSSGLEVRALKGNHEDALLKFLRDPDFGPVWARFGGLQTLASYGVTGPQADDEDSWSRAHDELRRVLPPGHLELLDRLELMVAAGSYVFVHAGIDPDRALDQQSEEDLLWIRDRFTGSNRDFGKIVVHGHTISIEPALGRSRIGIDTGAYETGRLTALRLQDGQQALLQVEQSV